MFGKRSKDSPPRALRAGSRPGRWLLTLGLVVCFALLAGQVGLSQEQPATTGNGLAAMTITLSPSSSTITACNTIQVEIWVNDVVDLYAGDFQLTFDPAKLEVVDAIPGSTGVQIEPLDGFLWPDWVLRNTVDNGAGTIWYAASHFNPRGPVSGSGAVALITLRARGGGTPVLNWYDTLSATKLSTREGVEIPATPVPSTLTTVPPLAPTLSISKLTTTTARLSWTGVTGIAAYHLYRDTAPYFEPAGTPHHTATSLSYDDAGVLGNPATNYYYVVRSSCANGFESANSNRVGEFDFALVPGPSTSQRSYDFVTLVLDVAGVDKADDLANYVGAGTVYQVIHYDALNQGFTFPTDVRLPDFGIGDNFDLIVGQVYGLHLKDTSPTNLCFVGGVPPKESVTFSSVPGDAGPPLTRKYNYVSLPLDRGDLTTADKLADDIGVGDVYQVMQYDAGDQGFTPPDNVWLPGFGFFTNFGLRIGYPYMVHLEPSAPTAWPVY